MAEQIKMERVLKLSNDQYKKDSAERMRKLAAEPRVEVYGNPLYEEFLGSSYSFLFNDIPVVITFDGQTYRYPKTIAELLQKKLDAAARANTAKKVSENVVI